jgi:hypothetical protein
VTPATRQRRNCDCDHALFKGKTCVHNEFTIELLQPTSGRIVIEMEGPSRPEMHLMDSNSGLVKGLYKVSIPGDYRLQVKFNSYYVQGNPFRVHVTGSGPSSLLRHEGAGVIRATRHTTRPLTFSSSAELLISNRPADINRSASPQPSGSRSVIDSIHYSPMAVRYLSYL